MCFHHVAFLSSRASFSPHFLKIVVEVKAFGPPHVLTLWLAVSKEGHAPCKTHLLYQHIFFVSVVFHGDRKTVRKLR